MGLGKVHSQLISKGASPTDAAQMPLGTLDSPSTNQTNDLGDVAATAASTGCSASVAVMLNVNRKLLAIAAYRHLVKPASIALGQTDLQSKSSNILQMFETIYSGGYCVFVAAGRCIWD